MTDAATPDGVGGWPDTAPMEDGLVQSGRYVRIVVRGRHSGAPRAVTVGYADAESGPAGSIVVAAGDPESDWARNLLVDPSCVVTIAERTSPAVAVPLAGPEHAGAIRALILRYGTPAEGLGRGPSFRLEPLTEPAGDAVGESA